MKKKMLYVLAISPIIFNSVALADEISPYYRESETKKALFNNLDLILDVTHILMTLLPIAYILGVILYLLINKKINKEEKILKLKKNLIVFIILALVFWGLPFVVRSIMAGPQIYD